MLKLFSYVVLSFKILKKKSMLKKLKIRFENCGFVVDQKKIAFFMLFLNIFYLPNNYPKNTLLQLVNYMA